MTEKIMFVDDDTNLLAAYRRQLRKMFTLTTAAGGPEGLESLMAEGPFAVVVADMRMPSMNGIEFLQKVKAHAPDTVGIMLTGHADLETAMSAVNEGRIFRFLTKPCPPEVLISSLQAGLHQYHLITSERELLERTLGGSIWVLVEIMSLVSPDAFSRAARVRRYVQHILRVMEPENSWRYEVAAMLSQIGAVTLPPSLLEKVSTGSSLTDDEQEMYESRAAVGARLLATIPRLETVSDMVMGQVTGDLSSRSRAGAWHEEEEACLGARILRTTIALDRLVEQGMPLQAAISDLRGHDADHDEAILNVMAQLDDDATAADVKSLTAAEVRIGMIADEDIKTRGGSLLIPKGQEVTYAVLARLHNFAIGVGVDEPFRMRLPGRRAKDAAA
jgi:CheY-like chemotaxis protein